MKQSELELLYVTKCRLLGLPEPEPQFNAIPNRRFRFDFCFKDEGLLVEIDGGEFIQGAHNRGVRMAKDYEKRNLAVLLGWRVLQFTGKQVKTGEAAGMTKRVLSHAPES